MIIHREKAYKCYEILDENNSGFGEGILSIIHARYDSVFYSSHGEEKNWQSS